MVYLKIAGVVIEFDTRFPEYVRERCRKYLVEPESVERVDGVMSVEGVDGVESVESVERGCGRVTEEEMAEAVCLRASDEDVKRSNVENVGEMEAELYAMTVALSELLPGMGRLMTHGVAVECDGKSYIFTAESGVGKSTHAFLWQKYLGEDRVRVINGDKPILWFVGGESCGIGSGSGSGSGGRRVLACGSPWSGKERLDENVCVPLGGICLLRRLESVPDPENGPRIYRATKKEAFDFLLPQLFLPHGGMEQLKTIDLVEELYDLVPIYHLVTDMSREGVLISSGMLLGESQRD